MIIDVGANKGEFILPIAELNPSMRCIAIEPIPWLAEEIRAQAKNRKLKNLEVIEVAISHQDGETRLNVSEVFSGGTSSILPFGLNSKTNKYWRDRPDLNHSDSIQVKTKKLESLLSDLPMDDQEVIDFIKIDVQGMDLVALASLGNCMQRVQQGMIETAATTFDSLYEGSNNDLRKSITFIENLGFEIYAVRPNDEGFREYNLYFRKVGVDSDLVEKKLRLPKVKIYRSDLGLKETIYSYENSLSWKVTAPLRNIRKLWSH